VNMPITRKDLPYLEVELVEQGASIPATIDRPEYKTWKIRGRISDAQVVDLKDWCTLLGAVRNFLNGDWLAEPGPNGEAVFDTTSTPDGVTIGTRLTFAGQTYGRAAILVEDGPAAWNERAFDCQDAVALIQERR
jgi:hypothetical protein